MILFGLKAYGLLILNNIKRALLVLHGILKLYHPYTIYLFSQLVQASHSMYLSKWFLCGVNVVSSYLEGCTTSVGRDARKCLKSFT